MRRMRERAAGRGGDGQGVAEFALILALIAILAIGAAAFVSGAIPGAFSEIWPRFETPTPSVAPVHLACTETSSSPLAIYCLEPAASPAPATAPGQDGSVASPAAALPPGGPAAPLDCAVTSSSPLSIECRAAPTGG